MASSEPFRLARLPRAVLLPAILLCLSACSEDGTALSASDAWILEPSAEGVSMGGLTVHNRTRQPRVLEHLFAAGFDQAVLEPKPGAGSLPPVVLAAHQATVLPPAGRVLRLRGAERPLHAGDEVLLTLHFDDGQALFVNARVQAPAPRHE